MPTTRGRSRRELNIHIVSTYPPRRCGLANFTTDLRDALLGLDQDIDVRVCAMDTDGLTYPDEVTVTICADAPATYREAARRMRAQDADIVLIEHEYGIFGGEAGAHVLELSTELTRLGLPYMVTPHTMLSRPTHAQATVLHRLCRDATLITMLTPTGVNLGVDSGLAQPSKLVVIPHGAPPILRTPIEESRLEPDLARILAKPETGPLLSTFGLLGPGKSLETAIDGLATVVERLPDVRYVIAGATHPGELAAHGTAYLSRLRDLASRMGLENNVHFVDRYLSPAELSALLVNTDVYLTPYRSQEQISSGTLTFAVAAGCPSVSTDYHYARDLLSSGAGRLVSGDDPVGFGAAVAELLTDPVALSRTRVVARRVGDRLMWPRVAETLAERIRSCRGDRCATLSTVGAGDHVSPLVG